MTEIQAEIKYPRVAITYCTQCKWMLRAAYFGQELMSTFGTSIGEVALIPATGGIFTVYLTYRPTSDSELTTVLLWDWKSERGFPETKILKQKLRNCIEPEKNLGHSDTPSKKAVIVDDAQKTTSDATQSTTKESPQPTTGNVVCEDCK